MPDSLPQAVILGAVRTSLGKFRGALALLPTTLIWLLLGHLAPAVHPQTSEDIQKELKDALALSDKGRLVEALPQFQHLDEVKPNDPVVKERLAFALIALAMTKTDPQERSEIRRRARKVLLDAQALGDHSDLLLAGLEGIPEDGGAPPYSSRQDVEDAMQTGETAFAKGDFDAAVVGYRRALLLDPKEYNAALFLGDVFYRTKEMDKAGEWFAVAVSIDPDTETAHRYWGDALAAAGKSTEAIEKYIDAVVAEPYKRQSSTGLLAYAKRFQVTLTQPHIVSPDTLKVEGDRGNIMIDPATLGKEDGTSNWMIYAISRASWRDDKFKKEFPEEKEYRHSLKEEVEALNLVADATEKDSKVKSLDPALATLLKLKREGLIEAYVLISPADEGVAQDYPAYRAAHRELVHRYISEYLAGALRQKII